MHRTPNSELWLAELTDPDGNRLALMSEARLGVTQLAPQQISFHEHLPSPDHK